MMTPSQNTKICWGKHGRLEWKLSAVFAQWHLSAGRLPRFILREVGNCLQRQSTGSIWRLQLWVTEFRPTEYSRPWSFRRLPSPNHILRQQCPALVRFILALSCANVWKRLWRSLEKWKRFEAGSETSRRKQSAEDGVPKRAAEQEPFEDARSLKYWPALGSLARLRLAVTRDNESRHHFEQGWRLHLIRCRQQSLLRTGAPHPGP